ncbi:MAG: HAD family hydrolase [Cyanophyceae cyanobacterium]
MLKAVVFDVDGTLVDTVDLHAQAWVEAFKQYGYNIPYSELRQQIGKGGKKIVADFISQEEFEKVGQGITEFRKEYYQENLLFQVSPFERVRELFERLQADGIKVVLATSAREKTLERYQKVLNIEDVIDGATSTEDADESKPAPDIFEAALSQVEGVDASEALVVGDSPYDAQAAHKINLRPVGVLCGGFSAETLREAGCIKLYQDPAEILENYQEFVSL